MINSRILIVALLAVSAAAQIFNPNALLLRYSFDSVPPTDESPLQRGQPWVQGNPTSAQGKIAGGARFNAQGSAALGGYYAGQWNITAPVTITAWFSLDSTGTSADIYGKILSCKEAYNDANGIEVQYHGSAKQWTIVLPGNSQVSVAGTYNADEFHHIAVSVSANNVDIYIDGARVGGGGYNPTLYANRGKDVTVGGSATKQQFNNGGEWHGVIDELRVYSYALNAGEVTSVYQQGDYTPAATNAAFFTDASNTCPASKASTAAGALTARADNLPKGTDGNTIPELPKNRVTLHRTQDQRDYVETPWNNMKYDNTPIIHNTTTLTITNTASYAVAISAINVDDNGQYFTVAGKQVPTTLNQGQTLVLTITFTGNLADKGAVRTVLHVVSNDPAQPSLDVTLTGLFMLKPEGGNEVPFGTIVSAFGFGTDVTISWIDPIEYPSTPMLLDETPTEFLQAADPAKPISIHQIAAFGGITADPYGSGHDFHIQYENTGATDCQMKLINIWAQTIVPMCSGTSDGTCNVQCTPGNKRFSVSMDGSWSSVINTVTFSDATLHYIDQVAFRFYAARNSDGSIIPNAYLMGQDYSLLNGCCDGTGCANCDYQDNIWLLTNVKPAENPSQDNTLVPIPFSYSFNSSIAANAVDKNGAGLPFIQRWYTASESRIKADYDSTLLSLDTTKQTLTYSAQPGSLMDQKLKNAFVSKFNPNGNAFAVTATVVAGFDNAAYAGVALGSDQRNYFAVYAHNGNVYATASAVVGTQNGVFPAFTSTPTTVAQRALPSEFKSITFYIQADPATSKIYGSFSVDGGSLTYFATWTAPGYDSLATSPAGRFFGYATSAGPIAWSDAGSLPVSFSNFAVNQCSGTAAISTVGTASTSSTSSTSSSSSDAATSSSSAASATATDSSSSAAVATSSTSQAVASSTSSSDNNNTNNGGAAVTGTDADTTSPSVSATVPGSLTTGSASTSVPAMVAVVCAVVLAVMA
ncbi:hypothetical protein PROFUN_12638 [Planoprotostelium fungivorum]|uniref:LamG-like jellyroll fold domain-containing protein n=1 Tax=Planoprotostelium fungivorum TaxID=1890364 RepID=A0A2P6N740_9EUKA|nr:hypothetical protein PROFUN_12638 [Planoprotostelium fungivorum]